MHAPIVLVSLGEQVYLAPWQAKALVEGLDDSCEAYGSSYAEQEEEDGDGDGDGEGEGEGEGGGTDEGEGDGDGDQPDNVFTRKVWLLPPSHVNAVAAAGVSSDTDCRISPEVEVEWASPAKQQRALLSHPAVKVLVTSGDATVVQEALLRGTPLLLVPSTPEDMEIGTRIEAVGAGVMIPPKDLTAATVRQVVRKLSTTHHRAYSRAAAHAGRVVAAAGGVSRAVDLVESALSTAMHNRHNGDKEPIYAFEFVPENRWLSWYTLYTLDVYAVYGTVLMGVFVIFKTCWSGCVGLSGLSLGDLADDLDSARV